MALLHNALIPESKPNMWKCNHVLDWQAQLAQLDKKWMTTPVADVPPAAAETPAAAAAAAVVVVETTPTWIASDDDE